MTTTSIFHIIISKFSYKKETGLIVLFIINKSSEINLDYNILPFCLAINLKVESNEELLLNVKQII